MNKLLILPILSILGACSVSPRNPCNVGRGHRKLFYKDASYNRTLCIEIHKKRHDDFEKHRPVTGR